MKPETPNSFKDDIFEHEVILPSSGKVFTFKTALARDAFNARKMIDKDTDIEIVAEVGLIAACGKLDGVQGIINDYLDLTFEDYGTLILAWNKVNFPLRPPISPI